MPSSPAASPRDDVGTILYSAETLAGRTAELGAELSTAYAQRRPLVLQVRPFPVPAGGLAATRPSTSCAPGEPLPLAQAGWYCDAACGAIPRGVGRTAEADSVRFAFAG